MTLIPGTEPYAIAVKRIQRKAQAFGTSALEIMLIVTFLILLLLLTYFSSIAPVDAGTVGDSMGVESPNPVPEVIANRIQRLQTVMADGRANVDPVEELQALEKELTQQFHKLGREIDNAAKIINDSMEALGPADSRDAKRPNRLPERIANLTRQRETALAEKRASAETAQKLQTRNKELAEQLRKSGRGDDTGQHDWPPIIRLDEADGYSFRTNSSEVSPSFKSLLQQKVVPRILEISAQFGTDTIEIVGHTDERPIAGTSTLDANLLPFLHANTDAPLAAADNAGLGFARAAAVARVLSGARSLSDHRLTPLSGAHVILRNGAIADGSESGNRPRRRRIEIRMRRSDATAPSRGDSR